MTYDRITQKKLTLDGYRPLPKELVSNLEDWFTVELTYTSNAIEGNTLTRKETAVVIEKGLTIGGKTLKEHLEATNHVNALDYVRSLVQNTPSDLNAHDILRIHNLILKGIDDDNAGHYRSVPVRISGSSVVLPNHIKVPALMDDFESWLKNTNNLHPVEFAAEAHYQLVTIHPFVDGNGRTARLLMNLILMMLGYPPAIIRKKDRLAYITSLEKAQLGGSKNDYYKIIAQAVERSLNIYLNAAMDKAIPEDLDSDKLMKIGELAAAVKESVPTIRFWTQAGLIQIAQFTDSGYALYDNEALQKCEQIQAFKTKRLTLQEILELL